MDALTDSELVIALSFLLLMNLRYTRQLQRKIETLENRGCVSFYKPIWKSISISCR